MPILSVIIMAFNEANNLEAVVREIVGVTGQLESSGEIVIVNDGSSDETGTVADRLAIQLPTVRVIHHEVNQGLGGVYRTGFSSAKGDYVTFFPADGQFPATIIQQFLPLMDRYDMVLGFLPNRNSSLLAKFLSWGERVLYTILFGMLPRFQGILMFKRSILDQTPLQSTGRGWAVLMELIIRASRAGYKLISVPTEMRPRMSGTSKVNNIRTIRANMRQMFALRNYL